MSSKYLACSVINEDLETAGSCTPDVEGHLKSFSVEEDSFMDALTDFTPDQSPNLHDLEIPSNLISDTNDYTEMSSRENICFDGDQQKVKPTEIFYEARDNNVTDFVVLTFLSRTPDSCLYDGIDSQVIGNNYVYSSLYITVHTIETQHQSNLGLHIFMFKGEK